MTLPPVLLLCSGAVLAGDDDQVLAATIAAGGRQQLENRTYWLDRPLNLRPRKYCPLDLGHSDWVESDWCPTIVQDQTVPGGVRACRARGRDAVGPRLILQGPAMLTVNWIDQARSAWPLIDMVGAVDIKLVDLRVYGRLQSPVKPACGILLGRTSAGSANSHTFVDVTVQGLYSVTAVANFGAECLDWYSPQILNAHRGGHGYVASAWFAPEWSNRIQSPCGPLYATKPYGDSEIAVCGAVNFFGGKLGVYGHTGTEVAVLLAPGAHQHYWHGTMWSVKCRTREERAYRDHGGLAAIQIGVPGYTSPRAWHHDGIYVSGWMETWGAINAVLVYDRCELTIVGRVESLEETVHEAHHGVRDSVYRLERARLRSSYARYERPTGDERQPGGN
jgi:hypothetical protein